MIYWAKVRTQFEGFHHWPQAPEPVAFLRSVHRHMFHVVLMIEQKHDDRDLEYVLLKRELTAQCEKVLDLLPESRSCEMIAAKLALMFSLKYPNRRVKCEVSEDGENGAEVEWP